MPYLIKSYCDLDRLGFWPDNDTSERIANIGLPGHCLHNDNRQIMSIFSTTDTAFQAF